RRDHRRRLLRRPAQARRRSERLRAPPRAGASGGPERPPLTRRGFPLITERSGRRLLSETDMSKPSDLVQGTLDLLLLKLLALEPLHGWAISLRLRSISGDVLQVSEGSL